MSKKAPLVMTKDSFDNKLKNMLRVFLLSIYDHEAQIDTSVFKDRVSEEATDTRTDEEFIQLFIESVDGFDYVDLINWFEATQKK